MKLISLALSGYRQFHLPTTLQIPEGLTGICGPNGVGKSKIIEAIGYALYGVRAQILPRGDVAKDLPSVAAADSIPEVSVVIELNGQRYKITRSSIARKTEIRLDGATDPLATSPKGVNNEVVKLLRLSPEAFVGTFVAKQNEVAGLQALSSPERKRLVNRLIGITQIELALDEAKKHSSGLKEDYKRAESDFQVNATGVEEGIKAAEDALLVVQEAYDKLSEALTEAEALHKQAQAEVAQDRQIMEEAERKRLELENLKSSLEDRQSLVEENNARLAEVLQAEIELANAEATITETSDAQTRIDLQEALKKQSEVSAQLKVVRQERQQLAEDLHQREVFTKTLEEIDEALQILRTQSESAEKSLAAVELLHSQAADTVSRLTSREDRARELGRDDACDACGQVFGERFESAMARFSEELGVAQQNLEQISQALDTSKKETSHVKDRISQKIAERNEIEKNLKATDSIPGEAASMDREILELESNLGNSTKGNQNTFSQQLLDEAIADAARHQEATASLNRLRQAISQKENYERDSVTLKARLDEAKDNIEKTTQIIQTLDLQVTQAKEVAGKAEEAEKDYLLYSSQERSAHEDVVRAKVQRETALQKRAHIRRQEQDLASKKLEWDIAARTFELMQQLLNDVTAEARPRLAQLMDGWVRALMGDRFQSIDLTEDYRVRADNGSGQHEIEHFSGGEQTLLAVMLRVAISIFCQERAGFETGFLILDEVFGNQDGEHREQLVQFLEEIKIHYHQILIVNHVESVTNMLDSIIEISRTGQNTSTIRFQSTSY